MLSQYSGDDTYDMERLKSSTSEVMQPTADHATADRSCGHQPDRRQCHSR